MPDLIRTFCIWCQRPSREIKLSNDHPIPQWLLEHYGLLNKEIAPAEYRKTEKKVRRHPWARLEVRDACTGCNNGWMSRLESEVKTQLLDLAGRSVLIAQLSERQEEILARWAVKTAFMLHRAAYKPIVIPPSAYEGFYLRTNELPQGTFVSRSKMKTLSTIRLTAFRAKNGIFTQTMTQ